MAANENAISLRHTSLGGYLREAAARFGSRTAFRCILKNGFAGALSFSQANRMSDAFAAYLREELGLEPGDRVAIQAPNGLPYPLVAFGVAKAGLVLVNINPLYTPDEIAHVLVDSQPAAAVVIDMFADKFAAAMKRQPVKHVILVQAAEFFPASKRLLVGIVQKYVEKQIPRADFAHTRFPAALRAGEKRISTSKLSAYDAAINSETLALLQYTGGTTGVSKAAMLTHGNLLANIEQVRQFDARVVDEADIIMTVLPLYHIFAYTVNLLIAYGSGAENILIPSPRPLTNLKEPFAIGKPTALSGVNTLFAALLNNEAWFRDAPPKSLRKVVAGGMALQVAAAERWQAATGTVIAEGYGLTEASPVVTFNPILAPRLGTVGVAMPGTSLRLVGLDGRDVAPGEPGELWIKGPQVMPGYWKRPDETAKVFDDGWLKTGDVATIDADGYLRIVDRLKDMIIVSGFNVFPNEIEDVISRHPGIKEVAVIGVPDETTGESPKAFIVRADVMVSEAIVIEHCRTSLAAYKVPRSIEFRDDLPKSNVGKVLRKELRK